MIQISSLEELQAAVKECLTSERGTLDELRGHVRPLRAETRRIQAHSTTAISLVGTDGGNNQIKFDPFLVQVIRVVDSSNNEYCLEVVTQRTAIALLHARHLDAAGHGRTALGRMMEYLGVTSFYDLSMMSDTGKDPKPSWVQVYRELMEWAVLFDLVRNRDFGTDTVIIRDGFLRSKVFAGDLFVKYNRGLEEAIRSHYDKNRRRIHVVGIAKRSKVLQTYQLAMALEGVLRNSYASYVEVPRQLEENVYKWSEYARGSEEAAEKGGELNKFVGGKMFFVKFGDSPYDPVWPVDLLESQAGEAATVLGYMLNDARDGFPVPFYPQSLQRAHDNAALVDFDMEILEEETITALRDLLGDQRSILDELRLQVGDVSERRYS